MPRHIKTGQIDEEEQLLVRLAWACEMEGLTQAAAAERFGVTRLRVNKALSEARERGIVRISIDSTYACAAHLEWLLVEQTNIQRAIVVPTPENERATTRLVAAGLGGHLTSLLQQPRIRNFGMSWGNTLNLATRFMQPLNRPDLEIISVMGGVARGSDVNCYEITTRLADFCNARHSYFTAPLFAGSEESRKELMKQDVIADMSDKIRATDAVAIAAGDLSSSLLVRDALPKEIKAEDLAAAGGVGDILGRILDADGNEIDHPINRCVLGLTMEELARIPDVILAAGGQRKVPIIAAAIKAGIVDTLVTDETTAKAVLKQLRTP